MTIVVEKKLQNYFEKFPIVKYKKRQIILKPGEEVSYIGHIKSGYVRVYGLSESGQETTVESFKPLLYLTAILAITGEKNKYFFEALSPVEIWKAPKKETVEFFKSDPEFFFELTKLFLEYYLELTNRLHLMLAGNAYAKVAGVILAMADKFGEKDGKVVMIPFGTPHRLIASMTGLTRETVTLQVLKMEKQGLIEDVGKRISIKNGERLREAAQV
jgi:CRP-like cAMP-binding protein